MAKGQTDAGGHEASSTSDDKGNEPVLPGSTGDTRQERFDSTSDTTGGEDPSTFRSTFCALLDRPSPWERAKLSPKVDSGLLRLVELTTRNDAQDSAPISLR